MPLNIVDVPEPKRKASAAPRDGIPRDGMDRPLVVPKAGGRPKAYTRTSTFADCLDDKSALNDWHMRNVILGLVREPSLYAEAQGISLIAESEPKYKVERKIRLNALAQKAEYASGARDAAQAGTDLHLLTELHDLGKTPEVTTPDDDADLDAYASIMDGIMVLRGHVERFVVCEELRCAGTPDRLVCYRGQWYVLDIKTGSLEYGGLKMAAQLAGYAHSEFYNAKRFPSPMRYRNGIETAEWRAWKATYVPPERAELAYYPLPPVSQEKGIILHLPAGSGAASLHWIDLELGWRACQAAKLVRELRTEGRHAIRPVQD